MILCLPPFVRLWRDNMDSRPIGVFDSGIGGLTVVKEIMEQLPNESIVYFGDTARVPYGTKSKEAITRYSFQCIRFLLEKNVKAIVVACIIGTESTVSSGAYEKEINVINNDVKMILKACPLFVPIVEEGWQETEIAKLTAREYLEGLKKNGIDALVMACTHYPLLEKTIGEIMGEEIKLVNPAFETAKALKNVLHKLNIHSKGSKQTVYEFCVSDNPVKFKKVGENFLQNPISYVQKIDIEKY
ncbi:MAG: murI [Clostridia bacterium]|nr:murI [Clostridia bacterium]